MNFFIVYDAVGGALGKRGGEFLATRSFDKADIYNKLKWVKEIEPLEYGNTLKSNPFPTKNY